MNTFLVTGGAGFIGGNLVRYLQNQGHRVRVLDDFSSGSRSVCGPATEVIKADVCDRHAVFRAMEGVDACFHLAAIADVQRCNADWLGCHRVNVGGSIAVFEAAASLGGVPVIWASSAAVYGAGSGPGTRLVESGPTNPIGPYGADKLASEVQGRLAAGMFGVPNIGLRLFNVYGYGQDPNSPYSGVLSIFCDRKRSGKPITIYGTGLQSRDFVHVSDVVKAFAASATKLLTTSGEAQASVYNVCSGRSTSMLDVIAYLDTVCGQQSRIEFSESRPGDIQYSCGDPTALQVELGVRSEIELPDGLGTLLADQGQKISPPLTPGTTILLAT